MAAPELRINEGIRVPAVRLIGPNNEQLGVVPTQRALAHAQDLGYDLVEIAPNSTPPVARILDFGKYRYAEQQKAKEAKKRQRSVTWKEIRITPKIDEHDIETKIKSASKFLDEGDKLKVTVRFRGRELAHPDRGRVLLLQVADRLKDHGIVERMPLLEGRSMIMVMNPVRRDAQGAPVPPTAASAPAPAAAAPATAPNAAAPKPAPAPIAAAPKLAPAPSAAAPKLAAPAPAPKPTTAPAPVRAATAAPPSASPRKRTN
ncbi:MAG: translation initiation factor IF-3 [Chloroflexi bacterium]|nr:MAG: translation initiation factor IF-3 [Chloroflexota bacterium]TME90015.1 MAG: translation initiation factor IF-3 [Chloroflexota bacterium]